MKKLILKKKLQITLVDNDYIFVEWVSNKLNISNQKAIKFCISCLRDDWLRNNIYK